MDRVRRGGWAAHGVLCVWVGLWLGACHGYRDVNLHADAQRPLGIASFQDVFVHVAEPQGSLLQPAQVTRNEIASWVRFWPDTTYPVQLKFSGKKQRKRNPYTYGACVLTLGVVPAIADWEVQSELVVEAYGARVHAHTVTERVRESVVLGGVLLGLGLGFDHPDWEKMDQHLFARSMAAHRRALTGTLRSHAQEYLAFVKDGGTEAQLAFLARHPHSLFRELAQRRANAQAGAQ